MASKKKAEEATGPKEPVQYESLEAGYPQTRSYEFIVEAVSPIAHHAEVFGNNAVHMERKIRLPSGKFVKVPIVTADTIRHGLREAGTYALLEAAGLGHLRLNERALRLLFSGGMVEGSEDSISLERYRELCELIPPLKLLGGCAANRVIPGYVEVGDLTLICKETEHAISDWVKETLIGTEISPAKAHVEIVQRVRMDALLDPKKRELLLPESKVDVQNRLAYNAEVSAQGNAIEKEATKSTMMPRSYETVVAGSLFSCWVTAKCFSALDVDTFHTILGAFWGNAVVGGKRGTGNGKLRVVSAKQIKMPSIMQMSSAVETDALATSSGSLFRQHVAARAERIKEFLYTVSA